MLSILRDRASDLLSILSPHLPLVQEPPQVLLQGSHKGGNIFLSLHNTLLEGILVVRAVLRDRSITWMRGAVRESSSRRCLGSLPSTTLASSASREACGENINTHQTAACERLPKELLLRSVLCVPPDPAFSVCWPWPWPPSWPPSPGRSPRLRPASPAPAGE